MTKVLIVDDHPVVLEGIKGAMSEYILTLRLWVRLQMAERP
jgi:YesN/AraC family two-component response regulator